MKIMQMKSTLVTGFVFVTLVLLSAAAWAQGTSQQRSACIGDVFRFCSADFPDVSKLEASLCHNRAQLSPACAAEFQPVQRMSLRPEYFR